MITRNFGLKDLTGKKFGRLTVVKRIYRPQNYTTQAEWLCQCDCGNETVVHGNRLRHKTSQSCGCLRAELNIIKKTTHGQRKSSTYISWAQMKQRCTNKSATCYEIYGGRGISVCDRWYKFENFLEDMGNRPFGKSLERKDTNGNYEPNNCKWATPKEQANNRRIKPISNKRSKQNSRYLAVISDFLKDHPVCPVTGGHTNQIHHSAHREGKWLEISRYWIAVSSEGHAWIEANKSDAEKVGLIVRIYQTADEHIARLIAEGIDLHDPVYYKLKKVLVN